MDQTRTERGLILFFRLAMGWTFFYAALRQVSAPAWSVAGFLNNTKTFHDVFSIFATPDVAPIVSFLVAYGHLLIGLSLILGLMVRVSASFAILLMILYWMAHMNFPYIDSATNFILDYHLVYAGVLLLLIIKRAGRVFGLDAWAEKLPFVQRHPGLRPLVA
ncbi:MAG: DoxX family membrane protein [Bradyrhizobiaceae bacterium]|nr:DoxX family membrane protein [Bradyrhizobiaceae bacterium]